MGDGSLLLVLGAIITAAVVAALWREGDALGQEWDAATDAPRRPQTPRPSLRPRTRSESAPPPDTE